MQIINEEVPIVIVSAHGIRSKGKNLHELLDKLSKEDFLKEAHFSEIKYGYTLATLNYLPFIRHLVRDYIACRVSLLGYKYPKAKIIVIAHSNSTWAFGRALEKWYSRGGMRVNKVILVGSVLKRSFNWGRFSKIKVFNLIATRDWVSWFSKPFYGMGRSGFSGFKFGYANLIQREFEMGHVGFIGKYSVIRDDIKRYLGGEVNC